MCTYVRRFRTPREGWTNGKSRRMSEVCYAAAPPVGGFAPGMKTKARLTLERFARFEFCFLGRTHAMCVCAASVRAVEKKQRCEREACLGQKRRAAIFQGGPHFPSDPLLSVPYSRW